MSRIFCKKRSKLSDQACGKKILWPPLYSSVAPLTRLLPIGLIANWVARGSGPITRKILAI